MCGILGIVNYNDDTDYTQYINSIKHRGPDNTNNIVYKNIYFYFHRLCINDLSDNGNQPFENSKYIWMCNGEIYNYKALIDQYNLDCVSNSDCEVIGHLLEKVSFIKLHDILDGVFSISIYDKLANKIYLMRDSIGVRPLYYCRYVTKFMFASEGKALQPDKNIKQLNPREILIHDCDFNIIDTIQTSIFDCSSCSLWNGYVTNKSQKSKTSYINFYFRHKKVALHRLLYENYVSSIPDNQYIKYSCDNKGVCCNINHMYTLEPNIKPKDISKETIKPKSKKEKEKNLIVNFD